MKAKKIYYKRLFSLGNYQNEEIGIEIEIEDGEKAIDVLQKAKQFVAGVDPKNENERKYNDAVEILRNKEDYSYKKVIDAQEVVRIYDANKDSIEDLPF
jgi:bifunctional ADP-heptose synthase (sugar kinase/adenylyltransferase)